MAEKKNSFIAYCDWVDIFEELSDEEAGRLAKHLWRYVNDKNPESEDRAVNLCFISIKKALKRDLEKYNTYIQKQRNNGLKGGRPKNPGKPKKPNGYFKNPGKPKKPDSDSDSVSDVEYIYSQFYDDQISNTTNEDYERFVKYLFGENMLGEKLCGVLSIKNQLTVKEFQIVFDKCKANKKKIGDILTNIENDKKYYKGKTNLYRTLLNWSEDRFIR